MGIADIPLFSIEPTDIGNAFLGIVIIILDILGTILAFGA